MYFIECINSYLHYSHNFRNLEIILHPTCYRRPRISKWHILQKMKKSNFSTTYRRDYSGAALNVYNNTPIPGTASYNTSSTFQLYEFYRSVYKSNGGIVPVPYSNPYNNQVINYTYIGFLTLF